jgi:ABC transport system ATP-binding/permease protein
VPDHGRRTQDSRSALGLGISAVSRSSNQYVPLLAIACVAQLVLAGIFVPITGRPVLEVIAAVTPAR